MDGVNDPKTKREVLAYMCPLALENGQDRREGQVVAIPFAITAGAINTYSTNAEKRVQQYQKEALASRK